MESEPRPHLTDEERYRAIAERNYWFQVALNRMEEIEEWRFPTEATMGLLKGTHHQSLLHDSTLLWAAIRWRELEGSEQGVLTREGE